MRERSTRRTFLRVSGGSGVFGVAGCVGVGPSDRTVDVPMLRSRGSVLERRAVPRIWYEHAVRVREARNRIEDVVADIEGISGIKVVPARSRRGGRRGMTITVELDNTAIEDEVPSEIPTEVEDVPVQTEVSPERGLTACFNDGAFDPVPGGVVVEPSEGAAFGTACCPVAVGGRRQLLTAAHLWDPGGDDGAETAETTDDRGDGPDLTGAEMYQSGRLLGRVAEADRERDVALVDPRPGDLSLENAIELVTTGRRGVGGVVTDWGLAVLLTGEEDVLSVGTASGLTSGHLTATHLADGWNDDITFGGHGVEARHRNVEGDSGGPVCYPRGEELYLVSVQQMWVDRVGRDCDANIVGDRGRGTAAYHVAEAFDAAFGPDRPRSGGTVR